MLALLYFLLFVQAPVVPYKASSEFDLKVDLKFQRRNAPNTSNVNVPINPEEERRRKQRYDGSMHAYIYLNLTLLHLSGKEIRCHVSDGEGARIYNKKVKEGALIKLDVGFVDEVKERFRNVEYTVLLLDDKKEPTSRITIAIDKDGFYFVNGEKTGKF